MILSLMLLPNLQLRL